jgi:sugar lactone lactonase YvrE
MAHATALAVLGLLLSTAAAFGQTPYTFTTLAGAAGSSAHTDGTGPFARFRLPNGLIVAGTDAVYVADQNDCTLRKVTTTGIVTTLAGSSGLCASIDGTGPDARFHQPVGMALDGGGVLYVADYLGNVIRKVTADGVVTTLAGLAGVPGSADGTGSAARFNHPVGVAVDVAGIVYVADGGNLTIRRITPSGVVTTLAGLTGSPGNTDGTGSEARFFNLGHATVDGAGTLYVADNCAVRKVSPAGVVTTFAGLVNACGAVDATGTAARFGWPRGVAADAAGAVYVSDSYNYTIRRITPAGEVTTIAGLAGAPGSADGVGSAARFNVAFGIAVDADGTLYVADSNNFTVRKGAVAWSPPVFVLHPIDRAAYGTGAIAFSAWATAIPTASHKWQISTTGGASWTDLTNTPPYSGVTTTVLTISNVPLSFDGYQFRSVATNSEGSTTSDAATLSVLAPYSFTTLAGSTYGSLNGVGPTAQFGMPVGMAVASDGTVYVAGYEDHTIRKITPGGVVTTLAGMPGVPGSADGTGSGARFNKPAVLVLEATGSLLVTDSFNHTIRRVTTAGVVTTVAGLAGYPGSVDGTTSTARFNGPVGIAVDDDGNIYLTEDGNHIIRKIASGGVVTTLAGLAGYIGSNDGTGSLARFSHPNGVAVNGAGELFITDAGNHTIRKVTPAGVVTTFAGVGGTLGSADGIGSAALFHHPTAITLHASGIMYVADADNHTIRRLTSTGAVITVAGLAGAAGNADGTAAAARFYDPYGITVDAAGTLYVADSRNNTIRKGSPTPSLPVFGIQPANQTDAAGATVTFSAWALGIPTPAYLWQVSTDGGVWTDLTDAGPYSGTTTRILTITGVTGWLHGDRYRVRAANAAGTVASGMATLEVLFAPIFATQPEGRTAPAGTTVTFSAAAFANPGPIAYQWQSSIEGGPWTNLPAAWPFYDTTTTTLTIANAPLPLDGWWFRLMATNALGSTHSAAASLTVLPVAPSITTHPENQTVIVGAMATFTVAATGAPTPTYLWELSHAPGGPWSPVGDGPLYSGATTPSLTVSNVPVSLDGTWYRCVTTNTAGSATSNAAQLTVSEGLGPEMVQNGDFSAGIANWLLWQVPDIVWTVTDGVFRYHRASPTTTASKQAVVFQRTGEPVAANTPLLAQFDIGNADVVRKRISALVIDSDFSDLFVCTFWLAPGAPLRTYQMRTHSTNAWTNAAIYFYVASDGVGDYLLDNVSLRTDQSGSLLETTCVDPTTPGAPGGDPSPNLLSNAGFESGLSPWSTYGDLSWQLAGGVFEFYRPGAPGIPAGVVFQQTGAALSGNEIVTATLTLGNSSMVRKRVTVLLHDADFSDLSACTFWLAPLQPLSVYGVRSRATKPWMNATISVYGATIGPEQWIRLDDVTLRRTPATSIAGTECIEPGSGDSVRRPILRR